MDIGYLKYLVKDLYRGFYFRLFHKRVTQRTYAGKAVLSISEGNALLKEKILSGSPYMVTRYGANELYLTLDAIVRKQISQFHLQRMNTCAGFFPTTDEITFKFGALMVESSDFVDMAALYYAKGEEYMLKKYAKDVVPVHNRAIEPWYTPDAPWTAALKGKRVLVIHPFDQTIRSQYARREKLFPGTDILPEFELCTLKAVQTIAGQKDERFETWFDALDYMYKEALKIDFDVAILGCGAYGLPLAAKLKKAGKQAVHLGGATQLLFGIKGARWDNMPHIAKLYNECWVRPSDADKPRDAQKVEGGCYW